MLILLKVVLLILFIPDFLTRIMSLPLTETSENEESIKEVSTCSPSLFISMLREFNKLIKVVFISVIF